MAQITYATKAFINENANIPVANKVTDDDMNEIKTVVNTNDSNVGALADLDTTDKSSIVNAINEAVKEQKILWQGVYGMNGSQEPPLSENISTQKNGVVLVFSAYESGQAQDYDWVVHFVPKLWVANHSTNGIDFMFCTNTFSSIGTKYIYFYDDHLKGHNTNTTTGTASGISYKNNHWVLRYVIGV